jgi:hypothetical protein
MARMLVSELHPISHTNIEVAFPYLFGWYGWCRPKDDVPAEKEPLMSKMTKGLTLLNADAKSGGATEAQKLARIQQRKQDRLKKVKEQRAKIQKDVEKSGLDPFNELGYGLIAYRNTLRTLSLFLLIIALITYPMLKAYSNGGAIGEDVTTKYG